jgi:hypothetical protein
MSIRNLHSVEIVADVWEKHIYLHESAEQIEISLMILCPRSCCIYLFFVSLRPLLQCNDTRDCGTAVLPTLKAGQSVWRSYNAIKTSKMSKFPGGEAGRSLQQMEPARELLGYSLPSPMLFLPLPLPFGICCGSFEMPALKETYVHAYVIIHSRQPYWLYKLYRLWFCYTACSF